MAISLYELSQRIASSMPLGTIVPYYGTDEPSGWKICDGRSCAGTELAKKLGISNVPDLRGRFIRMIGGNAAGMAVAQGDCIRNITGTHYMSDRNDVYGSSSNGKGCFKTSPSSGRWAPSADRDSCLITFDASLVVPTGPENRPVNMAFNYIIKVGTNVILYYVSNIIYKAIAIIKSLLSKAKEEVRRTMAISLKNHEDRIGVLESYPIMRELFITTEDNGLDKVTLSDSIWNYDMIFISCGDFYSEDNDWTIIPITKSLKGKQIAFTVTNHDTNNGRKLNGTDGFDIASGYVYDKTVILYKSFPSIHTNGWKYSRVCVSGINAIIGVKLGLKQYYCFSNNILYRLTQILFNSPFFWN